MPKTKTCTQKRPVSKTACFPTSEFHSIVKSVFKRLQRRGAAVSSDPVRLVNGEKLSWKVLVKNILNTNTLLVKERGKVT